MRFGITPDLMTIAKPLGGGLPLGAVLMTEAVARAVRPGDHGTTFGGNLLACHVGAAVVETVIAPDFLRNVTARGDELATLLDAARAAHPSLITATRGAGLMRGVDLTVSAASLVNAARAEGLIVLTTGERTIRLLPPLIITSGDLATFAQRFERALHRVS